MSTSTYKVGDLFTDAELARATKILASHRVDPNRAATALNVALVEQIVAPALSRINALTMQENNAKFLAYILEFAADKLLSDQRRN